jgi:hypothetical protein
MLFDVCGIPTTILEAYGSHEDRIRRSRRRRVMTAIREAECESVDAIHSRTTLGGSGARSRCTVSVRKIADGTIHGSGANWKGLSQTLWSKPMGGENYRSSSDSSNAHASSMATPCQKRTGLRS